MHPLRAQGDKFGVTRPRDARTGNVTDWYCSRRGCQLASKAMVFISPPDQTAPGKPSYGSAYNHILTAHRRSPLTSASSVILLVAPDTDALCASKMLARLFKQDDVIYTIIPVAGVEDFTAVREELRENNQVRDAAVFLERPHCSLQSFIAPYISPAECRRIPRPPISQLVWRIPN